MNERHLFAVLNSSFILPTSSFRYVARAPIMLRESWFAYAALKPRLFGNRFRREGHACRRRRRTRYRRNKCRREFERRGGHHARLIESRQTRTRPVAVESEGYDHSDQRRDDHAQRHDRRVAGQLRRTPAAACEE